MYKVKRVLVSRILFLSSNENPSFPVNVTLKLATINSQEKEIINPIHTVYVEMYRTSPSLLSSISSDSTHFTSELTL